MPSEARVDLESVGPALVARLRGVVDLNGCASTFQTVRDAIHPDLAGVVVDLTDVTFLDSAGIGELFDLAHRLRRRRQHASVVVPDDHPLRQILTLVVLDDAAPMHETVVDAVTAMGPRGRTNDGA